MAALSVLVVGGMLVTGCDPDDEVDPDELSADLTIVVTHPDHPTREYRLICEGDDAELSGEAIPDELDADAACASLTDQAVRERLVDGIPTDRICTQIYGGPDVATISGTIDSLAVGTMVDRTDGCMINDWDDLLSDLLPPAHGIENDGIDGIDGLDDDDD